MNYQEILERLANSDSQQKLQPRSTKNSLASPIKDPFQTKFRSSFGATSQLNVPGTQFQHIADTGGLYLKQKEPFRETNKLILDIGAYNSSTKETKAKELAQKYLCKSPENISVAASFGSISNKNKVYRKSCVLEAPPSPARGIINKYSTPIKRKTLNESSLKKFEYDRLTASAHKPDNKENITKKDSEDRKSEKQQGGLRQSGLELHKSLFRKESYQSPSRQSSQSSSKAPQQKPTQPQVSSFSHQRRPSNFQQPKPLSKSDFSIGKCKGDGKFGKVYPCRHRVTGTLYALKQIPKQLITRHMMQDQLARQVKLHYFFNHSNIVRLYGFFSDEATICLLMEYMEQGSLYTALRKSKKFPEQYVAARIKEITSALSYLHGMEVAHRDIKLENIVLSNGVAKLCDFGWAATTDCRRTTFCGTFDYTPPEIIQGKEYNSKVDLWSLGVMTYEMLVGQVPFYHISRSETINNIVNVDKKPITYPNDLSQTAKDFINRLILKNPSDRTAAKDLLTHKFLSTVQQFTM